MYRYTDERGTTHYRCPRCGTLFFSPLDIVQHMITFHGETTVVKHICNELREHIDEATPTIKRLYKKYCEKEERRKKE